jgi:hypothetical protein
MVFGNMGDGCGSGTAWSRDALSEEEKQSGHFLPQSQGGDMERASILLNDIERIDCNIYRQISRIRETLQSYYHSDYSFDFTAEHGKIYVLRTRSESSIQNSITYSDSDWGDNESEYMPLERLNDILVGNGGSSVDTDDGDWRQHAA